jgi:hypothetical protein
MRDKELRVVPAPGLLGDLLTTLPSEPSRGRWRGCPVLGEG